MGGKSEEVEIPIPGMRTVLMSSSVDVIQYCTTDHIQ